MADTGPDDWVVPSAATSAAPAATSMAPAPATAAIPSDGGADDWVTPEQVDPAPISTAADIAKAVPSGLAVGAAAAAGAPGGILDAIGNASEYGLQRLAKWTGLAPAGAEPQSYADIAASNKALTKGTDVLPRTDDMLQVAHDQAGFTPYEPKTMAGQFAGKTAEFLPSTLIGPGGLGAKGVMAAGSAAGDMAAGAVTKNTWAEPYARAAGAIVGGAGGALTIHGIQAAAPAFSESAARAKAAGMILDSAHDPDALRAAATAPVEPDLIPGSKPTSFQQYGDIGLGDIERAVNTRNPQAFVENDYGSGTQQQNAAQVAAMKGIQTGGNAMSVPDLFLSQKRGLEDFHDIVSTQAEQDAQGQADALGGAGTATQTGQAIKSTLDPQVTAAQDAARSSTGALGGTDRADVYGSGLRGFAEAAADAAAQQHGDLFKAIPKDITVPLTPVQQLGADIYGNMGPALRKTVTPAEADIASVLKEYGPQVPFGEARNLDTLITSSMRAERKANGSSPAYARMVQLKGAWEDAIHGALGVRAQADDAAVAAGTMPANEAVGAKLQSVTSPQEPPVARPLGAEQATDVVPSAMPAATSEASEQDLQAKVQGWVNDYRASQNAAATSRVGTVVGAAGRDTGSFGASGAASSARGAPGGATGAARVPSEAPSQPITQDAIDKLREAKDAFIQHVATYRKGPVGAMLRSDGTSGSYRMADSAVPASVFPSGSKGYQAVQAYRQAVGDNPAAAEMLHNYAASTLRKVALNDDGTLNPAGYSRWLRQYGEAVRALPDNVRSQFDTAGNAARALDRFGAYRPDLAPSAVPEMFFAPGKAGAEGVDHLRSLMGDQHADAVLSDHAAAVLKAKAERPDGTIDPRGLQQFLKSYGPAMERFPELADRFSSAAKATQTIADVAAGRAKALKDFQATAAGKFLGLTDPSEVRDAVGRMIERNDVTGLGRLMKQVQADPAAVEGVKRAAADHVLSRGLSYGQEAGASGAQQVNKGTFQNVVGENRAALSRVFDADQMKTLDALSADMMRQKRSVEALKMKGSPNTAADAIRAMKFEPKGHSGSLLREIAEAAIGGEELGGAHGAEIGAGLAVGNKLRTALRDAGMRRTYDVLERAVLDRDFFRGLMQDAPKTAGTGSHVSLAGRLGRYSMYRGLQADTASQDQRQPQ